MAKRPRRRTRWTLVLATVCIVVLSAAAVALLVLSRHESGRRTLIDLGAQRVYADAQTDIEARLAPLLPGLAAALAANGDDGVRCGVVPVADSPSWWELQAQVAEAIAPVGAIVVHAERLARPAGTATDGKGDNDLLRLDLGLPDVPTHALVLYRESRGPLGATWGDGDDTEAWSALVSAPPQPTIALIIDDWGHSRADDARALLDLPAPLTMSILPGLPFTARFAREATPLALPASGFFRGARGSATSATGGEVVRVAGKRLPRLQIGSAQGLEPRRREVILHLPMEPLGYPDPDPGPLALMRGMDQVAIAGLLDRTLAVVPTARGLNNHMGSAATADTVTMAALMRELRRRGLFFVDSQTSPNSVAYGEAVAAGVPALRNRIFLDHDEPEPTVVRQRLAELAQAARARGFAVGIGHPHAVTAQVLAAEIPRLQAEGVRFVTVSELLALQAPGP